MSVRVGSPGTGHEAVPVCSISVRPTISQMLNSLFRMNETGACPLLKKKITQQLRRKIIPAPGPGRQRKCAGFP
jgi:hypothetical protein